MFWDRLRVIFARSVRSAPKHYYAQERSTVIINLEGVESNEKKKRQLYILNDYASVRAGVNTFYPAPSLNCPFI